METILKRMALACVLLLIACTPQQHATSNGPSPRDGNGDPLMTEIATIVGPNAKSCGRVSLGQDPAEAWHCAQSADGQGLPHWFAMQREGVDSIMWSASLLSPSGERFILVYDSNYMGGPGLLPSFTRYACDGHVALALSQPDGSGLKCWRNRREPN